MEPLAPHTPNRVASRLRVVGADASEGNMADLPSVLRLWDAHMRLTGLSEKTRYEYALGLTRFYARASLPPHELSDPILASEGEIALYLASLHRQGKGYRDTVRVLRHFFAWAEGRVRPDNPVADVKLKKAPVPPAPDITDADLRKLMRAAFGHSPVRGWGILLCLSTGTRVGALVALKRSDVNLAARTLRFRVTKGNRPYTSMLEGAGLVAAEKLLEMPGEPDDLLLGVGAREFRKWVAEAARAAEIEHVHPHLLRHAAITRVARVTDPGTVAEFANWADLSQYRRYVAVDEDRLRGAVRSVI